MLSVRDKFQIRNRLFHIGRSVTVFTLLLITLRGEGASVISGYDYYQAAGSPEYGKVVYDERSRQWGYWTAPAEETPSEDRPSPPPSRRRARAEKPPARAAVRTEAGCDDCAVAGAQSTRGSQAETVNRTSREILKVAGASKSGKKGPKSSAPNKSGKRTPEIEKEEEREYDEIDEEKEPADEKHDSKGTGKFVQSLLKNASAEANRSCRQTSNGRVCKRSIGKGLGMCLQGVRMALQKTKGVSTAHGIGLNAKDAGPALRQFGYSKAPAGKYTPATAPLGAILIYNAPGQPRKAGHIEIKGKNGYYSDYFNSRPISQLMPGRRVLIGIYVPPKK